MIPGFECLVEGDSISVGTGQAINRMLGTARCEVIARVGAGSAEILRMEKPGGAHALLIMSTGSNDPNNPSLRANLIKTRSSVTVGQAIWILPYNRTAARIAKEVCAQFGDSYVDLAHFPSRDNLHPSSYRDVALKLPQAPACHRQ